MGGFSLHPEALSKQHGAIKHKEATMFSLQQMETAKFLLDNTRQTQLLWSFSSGPGSRGQLSTNSDSCQVLEHDGHQMLDPP